MLKRAWKIWWNKINNQMKVQLRLKTSCTFVLPKINERISLLGSLLNEEGDGCNGKKNVLKEKTARDFLGISLYRAFHHRICRIYVRTDAVLIYRKFYRL